MITTIHGSEYIVAYGGSTAAVYSNNHPAGQVRVGSGGLEFYDNGHWNPVGASAYIGLTEECKSILSWANNKMQEESQAHNLATRFDNIREILELKERVDSALRKLCQEAADQEKTIEILSAEYP
jgi:hypothetical protein